MEPQTLNYTQLGTNIRAAVEGDEIVIRINKNERHGPSSSGKNTIVAKTGGNVSFAGLTLGINAYCK